MTTVEQMLQEIKTVNESLDVWESDRSVLERMITQKQEALDVSQGADYNISYTVSYTVSYNVGS